MAGCQGIKARLNDQNTGNGAELFVVPVGNNGATTERNIVSVEYVNIIANVAQQNM
jgi:hypothetical protein